MRLLSAKPPWISLSHGSISLFQVAQLTLIAFGLLFTWVQLRRTARSARIANLLTLTKNHRELWLVIIADERFRAALQQSRVIAGASAITFEERLIANLFLLHMATGYELRKARLITRNAATRADVAGMIARPVFRSVWEANKSYHTPGFRRFVDGALKKIDQAAQSQAARV